MPEKTYFNKDSLIIRLDKDNVINPPDFVKKSPKNYRYNNKTQILQKKCLDCGKYFDVQQFDGNEFYDIHDEETIHFMSEISGYAYRCIECLQRTEQNNHAEQEIIEIKNDRKDSCHLTKENLKYIRHVSIIEDLDEQTCLNQLIDIVRRTNKLTVELDKKIK